LRDKFGVIKTKKEKADFRGTTQYVSPYVHENQDQFERDDLFSIIFVFIDLLVGTLPWTEESKAKDKVKVGELKKYYALDNIEEFINWIDSEINSKAAKVSSFHSNVFIFHDKA